VYNDGGGGVRILAALGKVPGRPRRGMRWRHSKQISGDVKDNERLSGYDTTHLT
jgi:hypothetical protein